MGFGYWIIVADGFGRGLNLINPRIYHEGDDNNWSCEKDITDDQISVKHRLERFEFFRIVRDWTR